MIPARYAHILFGFLLSGIMVAIVSCVILLLGGAGFDGFFMRWLKAFLPTWAVAFPTVLVVAPFVRRLVAKLTASG